MKLLFKKILTLLTAAVIFFCSFISVYGDAAYQEKLTRRNVLVTSHDASRYVKLTADGDTIYAEGVCNDGGETAVNFYISASRLKNMKSSFKAEENGVFSAYYSASCIDTYGYAVVKLKSGTLLAYRVEYNNGWFFGDNGLAEENSLRIENSFTADGETCAYYVSETLDIDKTRQTLGEIRSIALEITEGIDDDYQKAKALNYWVADNIYYDKDAYYAGVTPKTIALSNVLAVRRTVCGGYANIYAALLEAVGIKALNVKGGVVADGCTYEELLTKTVVHEWTVFWYEKEQRWVFTDPGWDSNNIFEDGKFNQEPHGIKYFDLDDFAVSLNHRADKAEYREYFTAGSFLQNYTPETEKEKPAENQILVTETVTDNTAGAVTDDTEKNSDYEENEAGGQTAEKNTNNGFLIIAIIILSAGIIAIAAVIIKNALKK